MRVREDLAVEIESERLLAQPSGPGGIGGLGQAMEQSAARSQRSCRRQIQALGDLRGREEWQDKVLRNCCINSELIVNADAWRDAP
jgi:hypothetical protein